MHKKTIIATDQAPKAIGPYSAAVSTGHLAVSYTHLGTGAIMAVPAHDERDFEFAKKHDLPIVVVIQAPGQESINPSEMEEALPAFGEMINSGPLLSLIHI